MRPVRSKALKKPADSQIANQASNGMRYYEVLIASSRYRGKVLSYSFDKKLPDLSLVTVPLRAKRVAGFIAREVKKPAFTVKPIAAVLSQTPLPAHSLKLARWMADYYCCTLGEALSQFAPSRPGIRRQAADDEVTPIEPLSQLSLDTPLTADQARAINQINGSKQSTNLLHGETGTGKTRVYLELAKVALSNGHSVILLTPEISLTAQLQKAADNLGYPVFVLHSRLSAAKRKKIWFQMLQSKDPAIVIGPRSALFTPLKNIGLIVLDEAHEPAYKQEQSPRYHSIRVASQLGKLTGAKVVLGTATPSVAEYYLANQHGALIRMIEPAISTKNVERAVQIIDIKDRSGFSVSSYISKKLIDEIKTTLISRKQIMIYLNRRGSARLILCKDCGWQAVCPNCDLPLVYHNDEHRLRCHTCGHLTSPPRACPACQNLDIIYKGVGTKTLTDELVRLFPGKVIKRFDSDSPRGKQLNDLYPDLHSGKIDILVGTQLLAKGLDLPRLGLVGVIAAETSLALPDFTSEERTFQLLYQIIGRVGRGHLAGKALVQTYQADSPILLAAVNRDYDSFYKYALAERKQFRFPPFSFLLKLVCRRGTPAGAQKAAERLKKQIEGLRLPIGVVGPAPSFYGRRGRHHYWQLTVKSKSRDHLLTIAKTVPTDWTVDLDPVNLL